MKLKKKMLVIQNLRDRKYYKQCSGKLEYDLSTLFLGELSDWCDTIFLKYYGYYILVISILMPVLG